MPPWPRYSNGLVVADMTKTSFLVFCRQHCASVLGGFHALQELPKWLSVIVDSRYPYVGSMNRKLVNMQRRNLDSEGLRQRRTAC